MGKRAGTKGSPGAGRAQGSRGPRACPKMLPPTLLTWFAFLFKYVSICFLWAFHIFLMTSSWFYMFFDDIAVLGFLMGERRLCHVCVWLVCLCLDWVGFLVGFQREKVSSHIQK